MGSDRVSAEELGVIHAEVAYATAEMQVVIPVSVPAGSCLQDAIDASGILCQFPEIDLKKQAVGVFSQIKRLSDTLHAEDRVEIYRKLIADPKEIRRRRAAEQRQLGRVR